MSDERKFDSSMLDHLGYIMIETLVDKFFELLEYSKDKEKFDQKYFKMIHDNFTAQYKRMSLIEQGEYTYFVAERFLS